MDPQQQRTFPAPPPRPPAAQQRRGGGGGGGEISTVLTRALAFTVILGAVSKYIYLILLIMRLISVLYMHCMRF